MRGLYSDDVTYDWVIIIHCEWLSQSVCGFDELPIKLFGRMMWSLKVWMTEPVSFCLGLSNGFSYLVGSQSAVSHSLYCVLYL